MKKRLLVLTLILILVSVYFGYQYVYQSHRDVQAEAANYSIKASDFITEFAVEPEKAQTKYLNKIIVVEGHITQLKQIAVLHLIIPFSVVYLKQIRPIKLRRLK